MNNKVIIADETKTLRFEFEALCLMQERFGFHPFDDACWDASPRWVSVLLWGGLLHTDPKLTIETVRKGMAMKDYKANAKACYDTLGETLPKKEADADGTPA